MTWSHNPAYRLIQAIKDYEFNSSCQQHRFWTYMLHVKPIFKTKLALNITLSILCPIIRGFTHVFGLLNLQRLSADKRFLVGGSEYGMTILKTMIQNHNWVLFGSNEKEKQLDAAKPDS